MLKGRHPARHFLIPFVFLPRKAHEDRPDYPDTYLRCPFQELYVLPSLDSLVHKPQGLGVQALDARQDPRDPGAFHFLEPGTSHIRLDLVEDAPVTLIRGQRRQQRLEVTHIEDVVHGLEVADPVTILKLVQLCQHPLRRLRPVAQTSAVQAAERALVHRSPPATARGFDRQARSDLSSQRRCGQSHEVVVELRRRQAVQVVVHSPWQVDLRRARTAVCSGVPVPGTEYATRQLPRFHVPATLQRQLAQINDDAVRLARDDIVHPRETPVRRRPHDRLAIRPAQHGDHVRIQLMNPAQQRQRRHMLLKRRRTPNHPSPRLKNLPRDIVYERGGGRADRPQVGDQRLRRTMPPEILSTFDARLEEGLPALIDLICRALCLIHLPDELRILLIAVGIILECRGCESPFASEKYIRSLRLAHLEPAYPYGLSKPEIRVNDRRRH